jgi:CubicO group peptidase (beta-lactamase class C family)
MMFTPYSSMPYTDEFQYGYGGYIGETADHQMVGHMGRIEGFSSINTYYPNEEIAIIVLSNRRNAATCTLAAQLAGIVFDV